MKRRISIHLVVFLAFLILIICPYCMTCSSTKEYSLEEIKNGKYVIYQTVVSAIPAQNYEIATLCVDGKIITVKGSINLFFENDGSKKAVIERTCFINGDTATIYISKDKVEFADTVTVR